MDYSQYFPPKNIYTPDISDHFSFTNSDFPSAPVAIGDVRDVIYEETDKEFFAITEHHGKITGIEKIDDLNTLRGSDRSVVILSREELDDINMAHQFEIDPSIWTQDLDEIIARLDKSVCLPDDENRVYLVIHPFRVIGETIPVFGIYKYYSEAAIKTRKLAYDATVQALIIARNKCMAGNGNIGGVGNFTPTLIPTIDTMMGILTQIDKSAFDFEKYIMTVRKVLPCEYFNVIHRVFDFPLHTPSIDFKVLIMDPKTAQLKRYSHKFVNISDVDGPINIDNIWVKRDVHYMGTVFIEGDYKSVNMKRAPISDDGGVCNYEP